MGLRSKSLFASFWFLSEICVFLAVLALSLLASFQLVVVWVCLRVFGLLRSFGFFDKFWLWFVLAFFTIKNEVFFWVLILEMSFAPIFVIFVIRESKYAGIRSFKTIEYISLSEVYPNFGIC